MDIEKLIKQRDAIVADAEKMLERRGSYHSKRPVELQEAQASRIEARIASHESARADLTKSIDGELKDLKADLERRRRNIDLDLKELEKRSDREARAAAPAAARKATKSARTSKSGATRTAAKGAAKRTPKGKGRTGR